jgi:flagellar hook-associated protein 1 FlgK
MDVTAHNIANASTKGYRRQEALMQPSMIINGSFSVGGPGSPKLGTGVEVVEIRRMQSEFIDSQVRTANQGVGSWNAKNEAMEQVEAIFGEPSDNGFSSVLDKFWNSWSELSASPESIPARTAVVENGNEVAQRLRTLHGDLRNTQFFLDDQVKDNAEQINRIANEIAKLNENISKSVSGNPTPNDLLDRRDILLDELSEIVKIQVGGDPGAEQMVSINGKLLIQGTFVNQVSVVEDSNKWSQLTWSSDGSALTPEGGKLHGLMEMRDVTIEGYIDSLNELATGIVSSVNAVYSKGLTVDGQPAGNFFVAGTDASSMSVEQALQDRPQLVVTSYTGRQGDNVLAEDIAAIRGASTIEGKSINDFYTGLVGQIGSEAREAKSTSSVHALSLEQLSNQRESSAGVSLDEEMLNLINYQKAYAASARMVTAIDEMIDIVVNGLGRVGR